VLEYRVISPKYHVTQKSKFQTSAIPIVAETPRKTLEMEIELHRGCSNTQNIANVVDGAASERRWPFDEAVAAKLAETHVEPKSLELIL
jgi:hypothetical protein